MPRRMFKDILRLIAQLRGPPPGASMTGRWGQMRQTTRVEVRLVPAITRRAIRWFGYEQGRSQSNFVAAKPAGTEDQVQRDRNPGNVGLQVCGDR